MFDPDSRLAQESLLTNRRSFIRTLGIAGAAASLAPLANAASVKRSSTPQVIIPKNGPPLVSLVPSAGGEMSPEWMRWQGIELNRYAAYLSRLGIRSMSVRQIVAAHAKQRGPVWNTLPPRDKWRSIAPTLQVIDLLARQLQMPVSEVVSVYRAPNYNAHCEGARSGSYHIHNVAIDIKFATRPSVVAATARALRDRGYFRGGVGSYSTFVHVDTRGENIDW